MAKKRANGEGSISKRKDGRWVGVATVSVNEDGSLKRKFIYGKTKAEVAEKLNKLLYQINQCSYGDAPDQTLQQWLKTWLNEYTRHNIKQSTRATYDHFIEKHIVPELGNLSLQKITVNTIQLFYNKKTQEGRLDNKGGLSPKTIRNMHNILHEALDQAVKNDLIPKNPSDYVVIPKMKKKDIRYLTPDEQQSLIAACKGERLGFSIILALYTGLRLGELLGLQWKDIDFEAHTLSVNRTFNRLKSFDINSDSKTELVIGTPKSKNSIRTIPVNKRIISEFKTHKELQDIEKSKAGNAYQDADFVFANPIGEPIEPRTFQDFFKKIIKKSEISDANFHALRHTFATRALELQVPIKVVSQIMGHANIQITLDTYSHVSAEYMREAMNKMASLFE